MPQVRLTGTILGISLLLACSLGCSNPEPLEQPFEYIIPSCDFFDPVFEKEETGKAVGSYGATGTGRLAQRRCSGNKMKLKMGLVQFSDESEASKWVKAAETFWNNSGRMIVKDDGSEEPGSSAYRISGKEQVDETLKVYLKEWVECPLRGDYFFFGNIQYKVFRVGRYGGEYTLETCIEDDDLKGVLKDYRALTERLGTFYYGWTDFHYDILNNMAIGETADRINAFEYPD